MGTPEGIISAVILAVIGGGVGVKLLEFAADYVKGRTERRRAEVDKAASMATEERLKALAAEKARDAAVVRARAAEEALYEARMMLLATGKYSRDQLPDINPE